MNRTLVLFRSKYGATRRYAALLGEKLGCDVVEAKGRVPLRPENYDCIVFAGGVYASGVAGLSVLRKNYPRLKDKRLAVLCVGASPFDEAAFAALKARNLKGPLQTVPAFYARGMWDEGKMSCRDRLLCRLLQKAVSQKAPEDCEPWMKALLGAAGQRCDWTDPAYLTPLLAFIQAPPSL